MEPDPEVLQACQKLKRAGYLIAVDDFVYEESYEPLLEFTDLVKVDFLSTPEPFRKALFEKVSPLKGSMGADKAEKLLVLTIVRATLREMLASYFDLSDRKDDSFMMGFFLLIDAFLDPPLSDILADLPIDDPIKLALLGEPSRLHDIYQYTLFYEKAACGHGGKSIIPPGEETSPFSHYLEALKWGKAFYLESKGSP